MQLSASSSLLDLLAAPPAAPAGQPAPATAELSAGAAVAGNFGALLSAQSKSTATPPVAPVENPVAGVMPVGTSVNSAVGATVGEGGLALLNPVTVAAPATVLPEPNAPVAPGSARPGEQPALPTGRANATAIATRNSQVAAATAVQTPRSAAAAATIPPCGEASSNERVSGSGEKRPNRAERAEVGAQLTGEITAAWLAANGSTVVVANPAGELIAVDISLASDDVGGGSLSGTADPGLATPTTMTTLAGHSLATTTAVMPGRNGAATAGATAWLGNSLAASGQVPQRGGIATEAGNFAGVRADVATVTPTQTEVSSARTEQNPEPATAPALSQSWPAATTSEPAPAVPPALSTRVAPASNPAAKAPSVGDAAAMVASSVEDQPVAPLALSQNRPAATASEPAAAILPALLTRVRPISNPIGMALPVASAPITAARPVDGKPATAPALSQSRPAADTTEPAPAVPPALPTRVAPASNPAAKAPSVGDAAAMVASSVEGKPVALLSGPSGERTATLPAWANAQQPQVSTGEPRAQEWTTGLSLDANRSGAARAAAGATSSFASLTRTAEKIAGEPGAATNALNSARGGKLKNILPASNELVTEASTGLGINAAKSQARMPALAHPTPSVFAENDPLSFPSTPLTFDTLVRDTQETVPSPFTSSARRAVDSAMAVVDHFAKGTQRGVNLQFSVSGLDLAVRVEMRHDGVHTIFRTDSPELRNALAQEWQSVVTAQVADRSQRLAEPVFTSTSAGGPTSGEHGASQQRESGTPQSQWEKATAFAPPANSRSAPETAAVAVATGPRLAPQGTARHLSAVA